MLMTECSYTPNEIDEMTLLDVQRLGAYWKKNPPLRALVAAVAHSLGVKIDFTKSDERRHLTADEFQSLVRATDGGRALMER